MRVNKPLLIAALVAVLVTAACGTGGDDGDTGDAMSPMDGQTAGDHLDGGGAVGEPAAAADADRTVEIEASDDLRFAPDRVDVAPGEIITFSIHNSGRAVHEFLLGDRAMQEAHESQMSDTDGGMMHEGNAVEVDPGETATLTWRFPGGGEVLFGCHEPGHYAGGMIGTVHVG